MDTKIINHLVVKKTAVEQVNRYCWDEVSPLVVTVQVLMNAIAGRQA